MIEDSSLTKYLIIFMVLPVVAFIDTMFSFIITAVVAVFLILFQSMKSSKFPITAIIFVKRKDGYSITFDRAKRIIQKGTSRVYYKLKDAKAVIRPADFGRVIESRKGLFSVLYAPSADEYKSIDVNGISKEVDICQACREKFEAKNMVVPMRVEAGNLSVMDEDMKFWFANNVMRAYERFRQKGDFLQRYMPVIAIALLGISIAIILYSSSGLLINVVDKLQGVADTLAGVGGSVQLPSGMMPPQ